MLEAASGVCQQYRGFFLRRRASLSHCLRRVSPPEEQVSGSATKLLRGSWFGEVGGLVLMLSVCPAVLPASVTRGGTWRSLIRPLENI